jgi:enoyl-CoA hydratase/carnithine racemase
VLSPELRIAFVPDLITADALFADVLLAAPTARLPLDFGAWGGVVWRIGRRAWQLHLSGATELDAAAAREWGIVDAVTDDPAAWLGGRSVVALDTAASLVALRGGDALERAAFAWLFATGEPQEGLRAFLDKRRPRF